MKFWKQFPLPALLGPSHLFVMLNSDILVFWAGTWDRLAFQEKKLTISDYCYSLRLIFDIRNGN